MHNADGGPVDLLLACLSVRGAEQVSTVVQAASRAMRPEDWHEFVKGATWYGVAPLLFKRLKHADVREAVPAHAWEDLLVAYFTSARKSVRQQRALRPVLAALCRAGIPVIALKGAFLAEAVYGDLALRPMTDADLMVPRDDVPRAQALLVEMGGVPVYSPRDDEWWFRTECHLPPVNFPDLTVEMHWSVERPYGPVSIDDAGLWRRALPATVAGVEVLALSSEDLLLHLCLHASCREHLKAGLRPLSDIAETINRFGQRQSPVAGWVIDWDRIVERARVWGATRYVGLTLELARELLRAEVPAAVVSRLVPGGVDAKLVDTAAASTLMLANYQRAVLPFDRWSAMPMGEKLKQLWTRMFCDREALAVRYPVSRSSRFYYLFYLLRVRDVVRNLAIHLFRRHPARNGALHRVHHAARANATLANWLEAEDQRPATSDRGSATRG